MRGNLLMITNVNVEFVISGDSFDLKKVSNMLNIKPTEQWVKDEKVPNRSVTREDTSWVYGLGAEHSYDIDIQLSKMVTMLRTKVNELLALKKMYTINYLLLVTVKVSEDIYPALSIQLPIIQLLNEIGSGIDIDMYVY